MYSEFGHEYNCLQSCRMTAFDIKLRLILAQAFQLDLRLNFFVSVEEIKTSEF
jgi:hypothetical protein